MKAAIVLPQLDFNCLYIWRNFGIRLFFADGMLVSVVIIHILHSYFGSDVENVSKFAQNNVHEYSSYDFECKKIFVSSTSRTCIELVVAASRNY